MDNCKSKLVAWSKDKFKARLMHIANLTEELRNFQMDWETNLEQIKATSVQVD